jgi:hypothetical protein
VTVFLLYNKTIITIVSQIGIFPFQSIDLKLEAKCQTENKNTTEYNAMTIINQIKRSILQSPIYRSQIRYITTHKTSQTRNKEFNAIRKDGEKQEYVQTINLYHPDLRPSSTLNNSKSTSSTTEYHYDVNKELKDDKTDLSGKVNRSNDKNMRELKKDKKDIEPNYDADASSG